VIKYPQFGLILAKGEDQEQSRSLEIRITGHFFCDLELSGFSGENGLITSLKNNPNCGVK
jgi:hypothetical protein